MRRLALLLLAACAPSGTATAILALEGAPAEVATLTISVVDPARAEVVASSTVGPSTRRVELEVPAERTLSFRAVARSNRPAAPPSGTMPIYAGSVLRQIPLGRDATEIAIELRPAGLLTLRAEDGKDVRLTVVGADSEHVEIALEDGASFTTSLALREGFYDLVPEEGAEWVATGRGLWVGRATETIHDIALFPQPEADDVSLQVALSTEAGDPLPPRVEPGARFRVQVDAETRGDRDAIEGELSIHGLRSPFTGVPATLGPFTAKEGPNAVCARVGLVERCRSLEAASAAPSAPAQLRLTLDLEALAERQQGGLFVRMEDARGVAVDRWTGTIDLRGSDPWVRFVEGSQRTVIAGSGGDLSWILRRPSGPRGVPVRVRAVATSTQGIAVEAAIDLPAIR